MPSHFEFLILMKELPLRALKTTFDLKPQESEGYDIGVRYFRDKLNLDVSYYLIDTTNEIQYRNGINTNVDPIERKGFDIDFGYSLDQSNKLRGSFSYTILQSLLLEHLRRE
ncbi:MAG: hypothetical protein CM15mP16_04220 [Candidatus Pelagibacterales bacterium]|nr:MAG: hypothetical protein CM15mP16_04220 [Pelagibacterales bacterium]